MEDISMTDEMNARLEKYMEGTSLGLAALAEVLQKMDARLTKEEEFEAEAEIVKAEEAERSALIKDVASAVVSMLKANDDLDGGKERKAKSSGAVNAGGDDASTTVRPVSAAADQQAVIQAEDEEEDDEEDDEEEKAYPMKEEDSEEGAAEEPADDEEDTEKAMYARMKKQLESLQKEIADSKASLSKAVQVESENRLRKMGFKEERRLVAPKSKSFGKDEVDIVKSAPKSKDVVADLANLSYSELRRLQHAVELGQVTL
jgi:hypothetical protein